MTFSDASLTALRVFREVAERGTLTAAATALGYTQSAVSRQIASLERAAGVQLVERRHDGVRLTPAGHVVVRRAATVIDQVDATARELAGLPDEHGTVRLGWFASAGAAVVPLALAALRRTHPAITVISREASTPALARALRAGTLDLALLGSVPPFRPPDTETPPLVLQTRTCPVASRPSLPFYLNQQVGTASPSETVYFTNYNTTLMNFQSVTVTGDFSTTETCKGGSIPQYNDCTVPITFTPTAAGLRTGTLTVTDSDPSSPQTVELTGIGTYVTFSSSTLNFGTVLQGKASSKVSVTLTNNAASSLAITRIAMFGDYTQTNNCGDSVAANSNCKITVTFTPSTTGTRYGTITITDSDGASPQVVNLTGIGTQVSLSPSRLTFPAQNIGTLSSQSVTVANNGPAALSLSSITLTGDPESSATAIFEYPGLPTDNYTQTNDCGTSLAVGASCTVTVTFSPTLIGTINASVQIFDNEADSPQAISLTGTGNQ